MNFQTKPREIQYIDAESMYRDYRITTKIRLAEIGQPDKVENGMELYRARRVKAWLHHNRHRLDVITWAENVAIWTQPLERDLLGEAGEFYEDGILNRNGLVSYVKHKYSNYEALLTVLRIKLNNRCRRPDEGVETRAIGILKSRAFQSASRRLEEDLGL